jgi:hypothetical protein
MVVGRGLSVGQKTSFGIVPKKFYKKRGFKNMVIEIKDNCMVICFRV